MGDFNYPGINWSTLKADDTGNKAAERGLRPMVQGGFTTADDRNHIEAVIRREDRAGLYN